MFGQITKRLPHRRHYRYDISPTSPRTDGDFDMAPWMTWLTPVSSNMARWKIHIYIDYPKNIKQSEKS